MERRKLDYLIISDTHLGMYGSRAEELNKYLQSVAPEHLILNGDFLDMWEFDSDFFPESHYKVLKTVVQFITQGTKVTYITGNHDEQLRKFTDFELGNFELVNKKILHLKEGKKAWLFHGDVFDASIQNSKWLARLGSMGYDILLRFNYILNWVLLKLGRKRYSLSKKIKNSVKKALKYVSDFEKTATDLAIEKGFDYVLCGHIHIPQMREVITDKGSCLYINSGDWIENLTAVEYLEGEFTLYTYNEKDFESMKDPTEIRNFTTEELKKFTDPFSAPHPIIPPEEE